MNSFSIVNIEKCVNFLSIGHVCATHLFAGLMHEIDTTSAVEHLNIAASLFLFSIRFYLHVFSRWWIEGQFKDWRSEFLIEKWYVALDFVKRIPKC